MTAYTFSLGDIRSKDGLYLTWTTFAVDEDDAVEVAKRVVREIRDDDGGIEVYGIVDCRVFIDPDQITSQNIIDISRL